MASTVLSETMLSETVLSETVLCSASFTAITPTRAAAAATVEEPSAYDS